MLTLAQHRLLSDATRQAIDKAVASAPVVLFMKGTPETPQCGFSRASIQILGLQGVDPNKFAAFNVLEDAELRSGTSFEEVVPREKWDMGTPVREESHRLTHKAGATTGIKEYSDWPTIPQLYIEKEFIGGCDILVSMHQNGELAKMLEEKKVLAIAEETEAEQK